MNMDIRHSRLRPALVLALACCALAVSAVVASGAQAAQWYTGSTETSTSVLASPAPLTASLEETHFATGQLKGQTARALEFNFILGSVEVQATSTAVELTTSTISNQGGTAAGNVLLLLKNATLSGLGPYCILNGGQIKTGNLTVNPVTIGGKSYLKLLPEGSNLFTLNVTNEVHHQCSLSGTYIAKGALYAAAGDIGSAKVSHSAVFSNAIEAEAGGVLRVGGEPAWFEGGLSTSLTGSFGGRYWQAK